MDRTVILDVDVADFPAYWGDTVPDEAFVSKSDILKVVVPARITSIGDSAFAGCVGLAELSLPDSLTAIGDNAFYRCHKLVELSLPDSLTAIGEHAFYRCSGLVELRLPDSLTAIGERAFCGCSRLAVLSLPDSLTGIDDFVFYGCSGLVELSLPDSLTKIGNSAFFNCSGLVELSLPGSLLTIGARAFCGCLGLVELMLPHLLTSVGSHAFGKCQNLRVLVLPPALESLDATAFEGSIAAIQMLVVPAAVRVEVATTMAAMLGPTVELNRASHDHEVEAGLAAVSNCQLVSVPNAVVVSMGGVFAEMTTMAEVRAAGRAIASVVEQQYWTVGTHVHHVCTRGQRTCALTLLLIGARLCSALSYVMDPGPSTQEGAHEPLPLLPPLPDELWVLVLGLLRRSELGRRTVDLGGA
jgi:hypothetical protein